MKLIDDDLEENIESDIYNKDSNNNENNINKIFSEDDESGEDNSEILKLKEKLKNQKMK